MQKKLKSRALTSAFDDCSYLLNRADCFWSRYPETVSFYPSLQANETTIVFTFVFTISLPRSTISPCLTDPCPRTILLRDLRFDGGWIGPDVSILTTEFESSIKFNVEIEDRFLISYTFNEISVVSLGSVRDVVLLEEEEEELVWNFLRLVIGWKEKFLNLNFPIFSMIFFDILSSLNRYFTGKEEIHAEVNIFVRFGDSIFRNVKIWYTKIRKVWRLVYRVTSDSRRREMEMRSAVAFLSLFIQCEFKFEVL